LVAAKTTLANKDSDIAARAAMKNANAVVDQATGYVAAKKMVMDAVWTATDSKEDATWR
jgi:hypothetical protein